MNKTILIAILAFTVFSSCDPDNKDIFNTENLKLNATIQNSSENISLGDTMRIRLTIPDTIITMSGNSLIVQNLQRGQFGMTVNLLDTAARTGNALRPPNIWTSKGTMEGNLSYVVNTNQKPYEVAIEFKPLLKGLYFVEIINQAGQFKINNNYEARLLVNFNVLNKHLNILNIVSPYFGGQPFYDAAIIKDLNGFGNYYFRVQ